jgi:hypothetical protein
MKTQAEQGSVSLRDKIAAVDRLGTLSYRRYESCLAHGPSIDRRNQLAVYAILFAAVVGTVCTYLVRLP